MQLGTRWPVGAPAPDRLPPAVIAAVHAVEQELDSIAQDVAGWGWTLTYLEQQPIVDLDDGTRIRYIHTNGTAVIGSADEPVEDPDDEAAGPSEDEPAAT